MDWSISQIKTVAPDLSSFTAGEKIARQPWGVAGRSQRAIWGEVSGSGSKPYQVRIDLREFAYRCTCPSRKLPCKHVLALLLRMVNDGNTVPIAEEPDWIVEWLEQRDDRNQKKKEKEAESEAVPSAPVSSEKLAQRNKRVNQRIQRVRDGLEQYRLWLNDLVRSGLAGLETQSSSLWLEESRRLVDSQIAPMAARVQRMGDIPGSGPDWIERLLAQMGASALLCEAFQNQEQLSDDLQEEIRQQLGWTVNQKELETITTPVSDLWMMLGQTTELGTNIETQLNWYWGSTSKRFLLYLQFAVGKRGYDEVHVPGSSVMGKVVFWPGTEQMRGRFLLRENVTADKQDTLTQLPEDAALSISEFLDRMATMTARQPWRSVFPALLKDVMVRPPVTNDGKWRLLDEHGLTLYLPGNDYWPLCSLTGSEPATIFGEWKDKAITPVSLWQKGHFVWTASSGEEGV